MNQENIVFAYLALLSIQFLSSEKFISNLFNARHYASLVNIFLEIKAACCAKIYLWLDLCITLVNDDQSDQLHEI